MWQLLASDLEILIHSGFLYLPLLFDPQIEAELEGVGVTDTPPASDEVQILTDSLMAAGGSYWVKSLSLNSLVENYAAVFPEEYARERSRLRLQIFPEAPDFRPLLDARLRTILFDILPHFLWVRRRERRQRADRAPVLAYLADQVSLRSGRTDLGARLQQWESSLRQVLRRLEPLQRAPEIPRSCRLPARELTEWLRQSLQAQIVVQEISHWQAELAQLQELLGLPGPQLNALLAFAAQGAMEVDGFGCLPDPNRPGEYLVYKRTGEYLLQDYFARVYLFPDCRVGVSTAGPFHPLVLDRYKHPLLRRFSSRQPICLNDYQPAQHFSPAAVIHALEEGLSALYYGYNSRKRNGYNSLDGFGRHQSVVDFEDWRLPPDDPRIKSGALEVKNCTF